MSDPESTTNPYSPPQNEDVLRDAMEYRDQFEDEQEFQEALAVWPVCPECGRRRITTCPICNVSGNLFPLADADFWFQEVEAPSGSSAANAHSSCGCTHDHSCHSDHTCDCHSSSMPELPTSDFLRKYIPGATKNDNAAPEETQTEVPTPDDSNNPTADYSLDQRTIASQLHNELQPGLPAPGQSPVYLVEEGARGPVTISVTADQYAQGMLNTLGDQNIMDAEHTPVQKTLRLVICHVCSEPFEPHFRNRCEWCGHVFDETASQEDSETDDTEKVYKPVLAHEEEFNPGISLVFAILGLLFLGALAYLWFLFSA